MKSINALLETYYDSHKQLFDKSLWTFLSVFYHTLPFESKAVHLTIHIPNILEMNREERVNQILDAGADVNAVTSAGLSPLSALLRSSHFDDTMRILLKLIECKADPNIGTNPLCFASGAMDIPVMKTLLEAGADVNKSNTDGESPLCCCLKNQHRGKTSIVSTYLCLNLNINCLIQ